MTVLRRLCREFLEMLLQVAVAGGGWREESSSCQPVRCGEFLHLGALEPGIALQLDAGC